MPYGHRAISAHEGCTPNISIARPGLLNGRSLAQYLWMWLEDAGREYGVLIEPVT